MGDFFAFRYGGKVLKGPSADGTAGQVLTTDGSGNLSFATASGGSSDITGSTAGAPSPAADGDSDTGLFSPAPDVLAMSAGGVEGLRIKETGGTIEWPMVRLPIISNDANEPDSIAIGAGSSLASGTPGGQDVVIGVNAKSSGTAGGWSSRVAIGYNAEASKGGGVAIGANSSCVGDDSVAIGEYSTVNTSGSIVIGGGSTSNEALISMSDAAAQHSQSMAFGRGVGTAKDFEIVFGSRFDTAVAPSIRLVGSTDQFIGGSLTEWDSEWADVTDATRKARAVFRVWDTAAREAMRIEADGSRGYLFQKAHDTAPADSMLPNSSVAFYDDGSGNLAIKLKDGSGTVKTGTVTLS